MSHLLWDSHLHAHHATVTGSCPAGGASAGVQGYAQAGARPPLFLVHDGRPSRSTGGASTVRCNLQPQGGVGGSERRTGVACVLLQRALVRGIPLAAGICDRSSQGSRSSSVGVKAPSGKRLHCVRALLQALRLWQCADLISSWQLLRPNEGGNSEADAAASPPTRQACRSLCPDVLMRCRSLQKAVAAGWGVQTACCYAERAPPAPSGTRRSLLVRWACLAARVALPPALARLQRRGLALLRRARGGQERAGAGFRACSPHE